MKITIEKRLLKSLAMMASVIEARDAYTGGHLWRVSCYCRYSADDLKPRAETRSIDAFISSAPQWVTV